jgi:hypothetical protein
MRNCLPFLGGVVVLSCCQTALLAQLTITPADIQLDAQGYYYSYDLYFNDLQTTSTKFEDDVLTCTNVDIHKTLPTIPPALPNPRWISATAGEGTAQFVYLYDFTNVLIDISGGDYYLSINSVALRDKLTLANNALLTEETTVTTGWSTDGLQYHPFSSASTPASTTPQTTISDDTIMIPGYGQIFYYRVTFTNTDGNGFDADLNQWNYLAWKQTDHFRAMFRLKLIQSPPGTYAGGDGSLEYPFQIATAVQLVDMMKYPGDWNKQYELIADIDMRGYEPFGTALISPDTSHFSSSYVGTEFNGTLEGNGYTIKNLSFDNNGDERYFLGLFGRIGQYGQVVNLNINNCRIGISGVGAMTGILAGSNHGTISNCHTSGKISGCYDGVDYLGGLVGSSIGTLSNCSSSATVIGRNFVGGLVSQISGTLTSSLITKCCAKGVVQGENFVGGLCGSVTGSSFVGGVINQSYATGDVLVGNLYGGGLLGQGNYITEINNCYATGNIHGGDGANDIGGLIGGISDESNVTNSYATGYVNVGATTTFSGGLAGAVQPSVVTLNSCFWDTTTSGTTDGIGNLDPDPAEVTGQIIFLMQQQATFSGWDFATIWEIKDSKTYPHLQWENACYAPSDSDINEDCIIDLFDFARIAAEWLQCYAINPNNCQ